MVKKSAPKPRREWRVKKLARLGVYVMAVSLGIGLVAARSVYGDVKTSAMSIGHELGKMGDVGTKRPLRINGEPIYIQSTTEDMPVTEVLDRAQAACKAGGAGLTGEVDGLPEALRKKVPGEIDAPRAGHDGGRPPMPPGAAAGVLREDHGDRGVVACLVHDDGREVKMADLVGRLSALVTSGDLAEVGHLRYVFAETTKSGRTHVVTAWTDGAFNLFSMLPEVGKDTRGSDAPDAPRPPRSQRILSADIEGVPYFVRIYDSAATVAQVLEVYDREMKGRGWEPAFGVPGEGPEQRAYTRAGADLLVITSKDGDRTIVSLIEMRSGSKD
jgi:hypothetical protein